MSNPPVNHHYIPICYLKSFIDRHGRIWVKDNERGRIVYRTPAQICYEEDLYKIKRRDTLLFNNLKDENYIESNSFKKQENNYRRILQKVAKYSGIPVVIDKPDYWLFIEFLVNLKRRNPFTKSSMIKLMPEEILKKLEDNSFRDFMISVSREAGESFDFDKYLSRYRENELKDPNKINDLYLSGFLDRQNEILMAVANTLYRCKQFILHAPIGEQFISSDNPGFTKIEDGLISFGGLGQDFEFYFPLSPSCCLFIDSTKTEESIIIEKAVYPIYVTNSVVKEINSLTKSLPSKIIISKEKSLLQKYCA